MRISILLLAGLLATAPVLASEAAPKAGGAPAAASEVSLWQAWGGEIQFRWNRDLAGDYGLSVPQASLALQSVEEGVERLEVRDSNVLTLAVRDYAFDGFRGGRLAVRGGYDIGLPDGRIALQEFTLQPRSDDPMILDVVANDGVAWFYIDRLMYKFEDRPARLSVLAMDLRIGTALAARLGQPAIAGHAIAAMRMFAHVHGEGFAPLVQPQAPPGCGKWHGCEAPGGRLYEADVFMDSFFPQYYRKDADANGPGGSDGRVVFVPSSTLRNNRNNGSPVETIPGDPLGTSKAMYTANIPWYTKFSGNFNPHGNDQHPYLIWNLYRIDADGRISQVGRSGVKHAWLTTNTGCDENPGGNGHILGRGCGDTYGTGNNDEITDLGPRSEIIPSQGIWGRCGSVYDKDCNSLRDSNSPCSNLPGFPSCTSWAFRMAVRESKIDPAANPGASYLFESWYIVRDDTDIYNTMQTRPVVFDWAGNTWQVTCPNAGGGTFDCRLSRVGLQLGAAIDRWMPRGTSTATERSSDIVRPEGQGRVAAKVTPLGGGQYRYDYAVMNFDFARATTSGSEPNLRVLSNDGFTAFTLLVPPGANVSQVQFDDGDTDTSNDWSASVGTSSIRWNAAAGAPLNWGTMFRFSFVTNAAPVESDVRLTTAQTSHPDHVVVMSLGPGGTGVTGFTVGGEASGLTGTDGADLVLNGFEPLTVAADGAFRFNAGFQAGEAYEVTLARQPRGRSCSLQGASGEVAAADVDSVELDCVGFGVKGTASGVSGTDGVELRLNGVETLALSANGPFAFAMPLMTGETYSVSVARHPSGKECSVSQGEGQVGAADVTSVLVNCEPLPPDQVVVAGQLSGLAANTQVGLTLNGGGVLLLGSDGPFVFPGTVPVGGNYAVAVAQHPFRQQCSVTRGSGTVPAGGVDDVLVTCVERPVTSHSIRFVIDGLAGSSARVQLNGGYTITATQNRGYVFSTLLTSGTAYQVGISQHPAGQACTVANGQGVVDNRNIDDIIIQCVSGYLVGGSVVGLPAQETVDVALNDGAALSLSANGAFQFPAALANGAGYEVELLGTSAGAHCSLSGASGTIQGAHVNSVQLQCQAVLFEVSGEVSGLAAGQDVTLRLNGDETLANLGNGAFAFETGVPNHAAVQVEVVATGGGATCSVQGGGSVQGEAVDDIRVVCGSAASGLFADGFED